LVGIDLINYGPFKKEDIANLPYENAKILLSEKFAEKIDLS
jgi:DNA replication initiation complex subunit (GINS family)